MAEISIELVPRSLESFDADLRRMRQHFPAIETVNVPDLLRFPLRSWEACRHARRTLRSAIPHLRAMDFDPDKPFPLREELARAGIDRVLVVAGDAPQELGRRVYPTRPVDLIRRLKAEAPELAVYAGFDPYRAAFRAELDGIRAKLEAGADGLFSQPFFDLRLLEVWDDLLPGCRVWWGQTPVLTAATRRYWETKNRAVFPRDFAPTLEWNRALAARCLAWARARGANLYFMPIRADLVDWLGGLL